MNKFPRLIPIWLWVTAIIIIVMLCSSCRGGRSLGKGSAGTVIVPQTPQQINERNNRPPPNIVLPPLEPLAPIPIVPPVRTHTNAVRSSPVLPEPKSVKANPVIINPKPAGKPTPFTPTINNNTPPAKINAKLIEGDGGCVVITPSAKNLPTDNKATTPEIADETAPEKQEAFSWIKLFGNYLLFILVAIIIWGIYDIIKNKFFKPAPSNGKLRHKNGVKRATKRKKSKKN